MIHHIQNLEGRLGDVSTTNTLEDDHINDLEKEANLKGTMTFRNWTDGLQEDGQKTSVKNMDDYKKQNNPSGKVKDPFGLNQYARELAQGLEEEQVNENALANIIAKLAAPLINLVISRAIDGLFGYIDDIKNIVAPEPYIKFLKGLEKNDEFNKQFIELVIQREKEKNPPLGNEWRELTTNLPAFKEAFDKFAEEQGIEGSNKSYLLSKISITMWNTYLKSWKGIHQILKKKYPDLTQDLKETQLTEGRYDKFTNELSRLAFELIKDGYTVGKKVVDETFTVGPADEDPDIVSDDFEFDFYVQAVYTDDTYTVDGGANAGYDDEGDEITPLLSVRFAIPKDIDWQTVSFDLKDVIRHELEHLTQDGVNVRPGKQLPDDSPLRKMIDVELLPQSAYFKLEKEVDAMLQGLYLKAKKSKQPFLSVIDDYLDKQPLSQEERKEILDLWAKRAKALSLPPLSSAYVKETSYLHDTGVEKKDEEMKREIGGKKPVIFCDMDGVLVDFDEGYKELTGVTTQHADSQGKDEFWKLYRDSLKNKDISERSYWANLDWMPDGKQLWDYIKEYNPYVLTAPSVNFDIPFEERYKLENNESMQGKTEWVQRLPNMKKIYFRSAQRKADFAGPNKILIDDRKDTIDSWNANGGIGILHTSTANTIKQLETILKTRSELNEIFEKDLPYVDKVSKNVYKVGNEKDIEAQYHFKLEIPERNVWSLNWSFTQDNTNQSPESWKQVTATSFKVLEDWLTTNNPKSIHISGNTSSKTKLYKNYIDKLQILLNNRYRIDNSDEDKIVLRSIEEATQSSIKKRMETLNESYSQSLDYFQNGDLYSVSKIERWESFKKKIQRTLLKELYKL
jgi:PAS domain-containing protein